MSANYCLDNKDNLVNNNKKSQTKFKENKLLFSFLSYHSFEDSNIENSWVTMCIRCLNFQCCLAQEPCLFSKCKYKMFRDNSIKTCILSRVKQITSPGWMHETSARAWCIGKTQRDWVEREVWGRIRMRNTCKSMADSCQCMTKPTTIL